MTMGERIKSRRIALRMSQDELAKKLGYKSRSSINKIECEARDLPQSKIKRIADALDTTPSYIMGWIDEDDKTSADDTSEVKRQLIAKIKLMDDETISTLNKLADTILSKRDQ